MNLNWWYQATGCGRLCAIELRSRLKRVAEEDDESEVSMDDEDEMSTGVESEAESECEHTGQAKQNGPRKQRRLSDTSALLQQWL